MMLNLNSENHMTVSIVFKRYSNNNRITARFRRLVKAATGALWMLAKAPEDTEKSTAQDTDKGTAQDTEKDTGTEKATDTEKNTVKSNEVKDLH